MPTYIAQVTVHEDQFQNAQDLVSGWAAIREDVEQLGVEFEEPYAILGEYDFHIRFTVDSSEMAFQVSQVIESRGFDTKTMEALPLAEFGKIVDDA